MDRFEDLRTFVTLIQEGGFAAAADRLGIVKSAVSRRIRDIEERLDVRLIHRTSRQISLTEAGRAYHGRAEQILDAVRALDDLVRTEASGMTGAVRISMPSGFATNCFDGALRRFMEAHPGITLEIDARDTEPDMVREGLDLALLIAPLPDSSLVARRLLHVRHAVCASPGYLDAHGRPKTPADLSSHAGIGSFGDRDEVSWTFRDGVRVRLTTSVRASSSDFIREAARIGAGLALLPTFVIAGAVADGSLEIVLADYETEPAPLHVVFPASRHLPARVRALIDHLARHFDGHPAWDRRIEAVEAAARSRSSAATADERPVRIALDQDPRRRTPQAERA